MKLKHLLIKGIALCSLFAAIVSAQGYSVTNFPGTFVLASTPGAGSSPESVAAADINGDGKIDLICADHGSIPGTLTVLTNNGSGGFATYATTGVGTNPVSVCVVDNDLISANQSDNTLTVKGNFGGFFLLSGTLPVGLAPSCVIATDVNGDSKLDLISANSGTNTLTVLTNNGSDTFGFKATLAVGAPGVSPFFVCAADVNGDGKMDLISANYHGNSLTVFTNNGTGVFGSNAIYSVGSEPVCVCAADVNGDGKPDLICANENDDTLTVLTNNGHGLFGLYATLPAGSNPTSVTAITNANAQAAIICAGYNSGLFSETGLITVFTNNANGVLGLNATYSAGSVPYGIIAADINKDGWPDLICADAVFGANQLIVLTNSRTISIPLFISSFSPASGIAGRSVTINGPYNFSTVTNVSFNGRSAVFSINSDTQITATVPTNASTGYITMLGTGGTATSTNMFTVPPPGITGISPASGVVGTSVTITGTNFGFVTSLTFNGTPAAFTINSSSQITATAPSCAGSGVITVFSAAGNSSSSSSFIFARPPVTLSTTNEASLDYAICNDSNITFSVSGTIGITSPLNISSDMVIDGTGQNVTISGNSSVSVLVVNPGAQLTLKNLTIANGLTASGGAGIYNNGGFVTVINCTFSNNTALGVNGGNNNSGGTGVGGGIYNFNGGTINLMGSTFVSNNATGGTGGNSTAFEGTGAAGGYGYGGAVLNSASIFITNCTFFGNSAVGGTGGTGGTGYAGGNNYYPGGRGGSGGNAYGGNIYSSQGSVIVVNDTFADGSTVGGNGGAGGNGLGSYGPGPIGVVSGGNVALASGEFLFINTIVANPAQGGNFTGSAITDGGNNLSSDATLAFTNTTSFTNTNPNLGLLTNNGELDMDDGVVAGQSGPLTRGQTIAGLTTDQRGLPRPSGNAFDIGAYELQVVGIDAGLRAYDGTAIIKLAVEDDRVRQIQRLRFSKNGARTMASC